MDVSRMIGLALVGVLSASALASDSDALRAKIAELEAGQQQTNLLLDSLQSDLDRVRAESSDDWLSHERAEKIKGLVQDVLADADTRASLQGSGATSGYDKGFFIASQDGNFKLTMNMNMQFRFLWDHRDNPPAASPSNPGMPASNPTATDVFGFTNQRTALIFKGHVFDPSLTYFAQFMWGANYASTLLDAWIGKTLDGGWSVKAGKFRTPFSRDMLVGYTHQLAVDRPLMGYYFCIGRSQGLQAKYQGDNCRFTAATFEAFEPIGGLPALGQWNSTYDSIAFAARCDWLVSGSWSDVQSYTAFSPSETAVLLGGAVAYATANQSLYGTSGPQQHDFRSTADATINFDGGSLAASVVMAHLSENPRNRPRERDTVWGLNVQGAIFLSDDVQAYSRYQWADSQFSGDDDLSIVQLGINYYIHGQNVKWTTDVGYSFNQISATYFTMAQAPVNPGLRPSSTAGINNGGSNFTGWTEDGGDGQWLIRSQLQLSF